MDPIRPLLERLYESQYGCPPEANADLAAQASYLKFILPTPATLDVVAVALAEEEV